MIDYNVGKRYARALFQLAEDRSQLDKTEKDFIRLRGLLEKHPEIGHLVSNSTIAQSEKDDFIEKVLASDVSELLRNFVKTLIYKKRFAQIQMIQEEFHRLYERKQGIQEVRVTTAVKLGGKTETKLVKALEKRLNFKIRLIAETDPSIIGGMVLRFGGMEINASYQSRLQEIYQQLKA